VILTPSQKIVPAHLIPPLTGKPKQKQFTVQSAVLTTDQH